MINNIFKIKILILMKMLKIIYKNFYQKIKFKIKVL